MTVTFPVIAVPGARWPGDPGPGVVRPSSLGHGHRWPFQRGRACTMAARVPRRQKGPAIQRCQFLVRKCAIYSNSHQLRPVYNNLYAYYAFSCISNIFLYSSHQFRIRMSCMFFFFKPGLLLNVNAMEDLLPLQSVCASLMKRFHAPQRPRTILPHTPSSSGLSGWVSSVNAINPVRLAANGPAPHCPSP